MSSLPATRAPFPQGMVTRDQPAMVILDSASLAVAIRCLHEAAYQARQHTT